MQLLREKKTYAVRAIRQDTTVGVVFFEKVKSAKNAVYIRQTAVQIEMQKKGIGGHLVFSIREDGSLLPDTKTLFVIVRYVNKSAIAFYKSLGFESSSYMHEGYSTEKYAGFEWHAKGESR